MQLFLKFNWVLVILLSISTGMFKILQQESDIELFAVIGFDATMTTMLGAIQLLGGILLISNRTRKAGAWIMILTFVLASVAVFANEMYIFGLVSVLFIGMAFLTTRLEKPEPN